MTKEEFKTGLICTTYVTTSGVSRYVTIPMAAFIIYTYNFMKLSRAILKLKLDFYTS